MTRRWLSRPWQGAIAGVAIGCLVVAGLAITRGATREGGDSVAPIVTTAASAQAFVDAWSRMVQGTWSTDATFTRRVEDGRQVQFAIREVQRPPDYLRETQGSVEASIGGTRYVCAAIDGQASRCAAAGAASSGESKGRAAVEAVRAHVLGPRRTYGVAQEAGGCFRLLAVPAPTVPQWGHDARFCFDANSGAMVRSEQHRSGAIDSTIVNRLSATVTDEELRLPAAVS